MKRSLIYLLLLAMLLSMLGGCAAAGNAEDSETSSVERTTLSTENGGGESEDTAPEPETEAEMAPEPEKAPEQEAGAEPEKTTYNGETAFSIEYEKEEAPAEAGSLLGQALQTDLAPLPSQEFLPLSEEELEALAEELEAEDSGEDAAASPLQEGIVPFGEQTNLTGGQQTTLNGGTAPRQLTIEDIQAMNPDSVVIDIYTNEGYLSLLIGKYYDKKVTNVEEGVESIQGMAALLGLSKGCDFFAVYSETNNTGYTFYTYQQRYGGYTLRYATLRIAVDPEGYTAGLSCSFIPNVGTASQEEGISGDEAETIVRDLFANFDLTYYPEHTVRLAAPFNNVVYNCWVVYTNNPDATASFDMPYLEHYVTTDGKYLTLIPANDFARDNAGVMDNTGYFEGMQVEQYTASVLLEDGSSRELAVPVSFNSKDGLYYLMDPERMIAVAEYYDFNYRNTVSFVTSSTIDGWSQNNLLAYANYIAVYDFYASHGIRSVDGFGTPILITVGWCDENRNPVNNACFYGVNLGWACFGVSDVNHYSDCVDVVGHEYTHGVTRQSMQGVAYRNEPGSINESYSDIMGNLIEMSLNYTSDRSWKVGEKTGSITRDMGNPNAYGQPAFVGDEYYVSAVLNPNYEVNDYGGVHANNSLVGHIAYLMDQTGMSYEQQVSMWLTAVEMLTPLADYQDLHGALLFALKVNGMLNDYGPALNQAFAAAGLNDDWTESYLNATKDGCGRVTVMTDEAIASSAAVLSFAAAGGSQIVAEGYPDANGVISVLLPTGEYIAQLMVLEDSGEVYYNYTGSLWRQSGDFGTIRVSDGAVTELTGTSGGQSAYEPLDLIQFDGGYFSMLMPYGWRIEVNGQYASFSVKIFDPEDPSTQLFYYGGLRPFHKSELTRRYWAVYDSTGTISNGPVLPSADILGILSTWAYDIEFQKFYEKQLFTDLYDITVLGAYNYSGNYASRGAIESGCFASCATNYDSDCRLTITSSLIDEDYYSYFGGNYFYTCRDLCGILAPAERYDAVFDDLITCLESLQFTRQYISQSQTSDDPMTDQTSIKKGLALLGGVMTAIYQEHC